MIIGFRCRETEGLWNGRFSRSLPPTIQKTALRKLQMLDAAGVLDDLKIPPNNHLEALKGDLKGKCSIRINQQWRLVFVWTSGGVKDVEIIDYH
jgi:proteic killer suppression protein